MIRISRESLRRNMEVLIHNGRLTISGQVLDAVGNWVTLEVLRNEAGEVIYAQGFSLIDDAVIWVIKEPVDRLLPEAEPLPRSSG